MLFFIHTLVSRKIKITCIFNYQIKNIPMNYIGISLFVGLSRRNLWIPLIERFQKKLIGQKWSIISITRKCLLVKTILQSMDVYYASVFKILISICEKIDQICNIFLYMSMDERKRIALVTQTKVNKSKYQGGLRLHSV